MRARLVILLALSTASALGSEVPLAETREGAVLVGVDALGRVLIAMDIRPTDGLADLCFLFTAESRLAGPWSRRAEGAHAIIKHDRLTLVAPDLHVSLALKGTPDSSPAAAAQGAFVNHDGVELARVPAPGPAISMAALRVEDLESGWPEPFEYDILAPETSCGLTCPSGGDGATSCSIGGCTKVPTSCSVSCGGAFIACCNCNPWAQCRCVKCL